MREVIERHGGTVEKFIGDAVMAVFGVPAAPRGRRPARRAGRGGDAARRSRGSNDELEAEAGSVGIRIGVKTGEVVAGESAAAERS